MKKTLTLVVTLLLLTIMLSGCAKIDYQIKINKDGSGEIAYIYGIDKTIIKSTGQTKEKIVEKQQKNAEESGYEIEPYEDNQIAGFKATKMIEDLSNGSVLLEIFKDKYIPEKEASKINIKKATFGKKYSQKTIIDLSSLQEFKELAPTIKYTINLPTKVTKTNANEISTDKKVISWNLVAGEKNEINFEADSGRLYRITTIVLLVIILISVVVFILLKNIKNNDKNNKKKINSKKLKINQPKRIQKTTQANGINKSKVNNQETVQHKETNKNTIVEKAKKTKLNSKAKENEKMKQNNKKKTEKIVKKAVQNSEKNKIVNSIKEKQTQEGKSNEKGNKKE